MEKSRIITQMDILEKLMTGRSSFKSKDDEIIHYRNVTSKILNLLEGSEQMYRDVILKTPSQVDSLINVLQTNMDSQVMYTIIKIINELVGRSNGQKRAQILVHHGVTRALLQCIYIESKEAIPCEDYLFLLHQVLYRIGLKDKKIGVRARLSQCLPVIVNLLRAQVNLVPHSRTNATNISISSSLSKNILILLNIARLYSQNLINASRLGRNGLISVLFKIIGYSGKNNLSLLKITLETLNLCVRSKSNGARAVNHGAMAVLLQLFLDWNRIDSRDKQLALRRCILHAVKNLINLRAGRKAFLEADGLHTFYGYCEACKFQNNVESVVTLASLILRKCFPRNRLPLSNYDSTLRCPLPTSGVKEKSKYLLELRKGVISPSAPRSTSPNDGFPVIPFLGCQGDNDAFPSQKKGINRDRSPESVEFNQDFDVEENIYPDVMKESNRQRAHNLFRNLDRKLSESKSKGASQISHQNYMGRYASNSNSVPPIRVPPSTILKDSDDYLGLDPDQFEDKDQKDEQEEQCLVERILMNGSGYQPPDDRLFDKLKDSYSMFFFEMDIFKNESKRKSSMDYQEEVIDKKSYENNRTTGDNKKKQIKDRETVQPSLVSLEMKPSALEKKLSRSLIFRNESIIPKTIENTEDRNLSLSCAGIGLQRSGVSNSQVPGLYQRSKRSLTVNKSETINVNNLIQNLTDNNERPAVTAKKPVTESSSISHTKEEFMQTYIKISGAVTRSLGRFSMIAYPDLWEQSSMMKDPEPLTETFIQNQSTSSLDGSEKLSVNEKRNRTNSLPQSKKQSNKSNGNNKSNSNQRPMSASSNVDSLAQNKILDDLRRVIDSEDVIEKVVYDLDDIVNETYTTYNLEYSNHSNSDELELDKLNPLVSPHLMFDSQFESGNLRKVIQIRQYEYDLILSPDINTNHHTQWFYFRVSAMEAGVPYRFNIINCEKPNSQFNFGMQPLLFSVKEAIRGRGYWKRWGSEIFYYKNHFARSAATCGGNIGKSYFTCTFMIEFPNTGDVCYMAYHYPYTYTRLLTDIHMWTRQVKSAKKEDKYDGDGDSKDKSSRHNIEFQSDIDDGILFSVQDLCPTMLKNPVPLITITNWPKETNDRQSTTKPYVFLSSRVHPGESNASWVIKGCLDYLLSDNPTAVHLRDTYIFKIVPMLNPDGVINGCHRCSMAGQDLNRRWLDPCEILNPTIYNTKGLLMLLTKLGQAPMVYCDFHGHSRRKNVFMFGCSSLLSWINDDTNNPAYVDQRSEDQSYYTLPNILNKIAPQFSIECCSFSVDKVKESTARVVVWRQFGVKRSYTMESSYCSCDQGAFKHLHINVPMLEDMGGRFAESLLHIDEASSVPVFRNTTFQSSTLTSSVSEKNLTSKFDQYSGYSQPINSKRPQTAGKQKGRLDDEFSVDCGVEKCIDNDEDDEDEVSDNYEEFVEEESDKDNEYIDEYNVEDSD